MTGAQLERLLSIGKSLGVPAHHVVSRGAVAVGVGKLSINLDCPAVVGYGKVILSFCAVGSTTIVVSARICWSEFDGFSVVSNGVIQIALRAISSTAAVVGPGEVRIDFETVVRANSCAQAEIVSLISR